MSVKTMRKLDIKFANRVQKTLENIIPEKYLKDFTKEQKLMALQINFKVKPIFDEDKKMVPMWFDFKNVFLMKLTPIEMIMAGQGKKVLYYLDKKLGNVSINPYFRK